MPRVVILWEDQLAVASKTFGPHQLALACLADEFGEPSRWALRDALISIPCKGDGNLVKRLEREGSLLTRSGEHLVAVLDDDAVRRLYGLAPDSCKSVVLSAIRSR
jgi:hypothetical protein